MSFGLPPGTEPPDAPQPSASGDWFPHVVDQRRQDDGTVLVTFAMPGLTRMTVRVPLTAWLNGEHTRIALLPDSLVSALYHVPAHGEDEQDFG